MLLSRISTSQMSFLRLAGRGIARNVNKQTFNVKRASLYCGAIVVSSYATAAIWQYERQKRAIQGSIKDLFWELKTSAEKRYSTLKPGVRMVLPIVAMNVSVFFAWRIRTLLPMMRLHFLSRVDSNKYLTQLILPAFSHTNGTHLMINMFVLWSMSEPAYMMWGPEQFYATYISAASISILFSQFVKMIRAQKTASLGASGSIMAVLAAICTRFPDSRMAIIFLPMFSFSADSALKGILAFDTAGLLLGYLRLDHAAHLAGALFGLWYVKYGHQFLWDNKNQFVKRYKKLTGR